MGELCNYEAPFELIDFTVNVDHRQGRGIFAEATVKVRVPGCAEVLHRQRNHLSADQADDLEEMVGHIETGDEVEAHRQRYAQSKSLIDLRLLVAGLWTRRDPKQLAD